MTPVAREVWIIRSRLAIRSLWRGRHHDPHARERIHAWVRVLRPLLGEHHASRPRVSVVVRSLADVDLDYLAIATGVRRDLIDIEAAS